MELSKKERLLLINQYRILSILNPSESDVYKNYIKVLEFGYKSHYGDMVDWLSDDMSEEDCEEVLNIFDMYRALTYSHEQLVDKEGIDYYDIKFRGFDGNHEAAQLLYAEYFMYDLDKYRELQKPGEHPDHNSHAPTLRKYRAMLLIYNNKPNKNNLSKNDILDIVNAKNW